ncbi:MAG: transcriptional regulator, MerR family [Acidimicrobiales bacterium]|nr:transcriptional regulator, MerR family [Acidimicrobiales bacterium]
MLEKCLDLQVDVKVYAPQVTTAYRIKDVADRSGFSAATLRYYEEIGLLPTSLRTPAGYRTYDDRTLERLAFIARAKQLGCTLDEIAELTLAWDGGSCGPVQDRLRTAVADKLVTAQEQIVELMTLSSELRLAAATLEAHRPDGACDDSCGCIGVPAAPGDTPEPQLVSLGPNPAACVESAPIACTLGSLALKGRIADWQRLLGHVAGREPIVDGVRAVFTSTVPLDDLIRLTAAEQDCCQFLRFSITVDTRGIGLEVTAPADAQAIIDSLFGATV